MRKGKGLDHWQKVISDWRGSGLRRSEFCARNGIATSTFDYWHKKARATESAFVPVPIAISDAKSAKIRISIDGRLTIELISGFDPEDQDLAGVLRAVGVIS